jgi:hypothetical protein
LHDPEGGVRAAIALLLPLRDLPLSPEAARYWALLADDLLDFLDAAGQIAVPSDGTE